MDYKLTSEDKERVGLLGTVSKRGLRTLDLQQLKRLQVLVEKKDYTHSKKAQRSKTKLLAKINTAIYEAEEGRRM